MIVIKTKPWKDLNFQSFFEKVFFWKDEDAPIIEKLTDLCMYGFNYEPPPLFQNDRKYITLEEFVDSVDYNQSKFTKIQKLLHKYNSIDKNIDFVKIQNHDIWNLDATLATIIYPALIKLKEDNNGIPFVEDEDVPDHLKTLKENREDNYCIHKWHYVLDKMIFAFKAENIDLAYDHDQKETKEALEEGYRLFGKYYTSLWT